MTARKPSRGQPRNVSPWPGQHWTTSVYWAKVIECADLDAVTKAVALVLAANWQTSTKTTHPGVTRIAASLRRTVRTVLHHLAVLEDAGLIFCARRAGQPGMERGHANEYYLTTHDALAKITLPGFSIPHEPARTAA